MASECVKTFVMQAKLSINNTDPVSIPNYTVGEAMPYFFGNPDGSIITKIKASLAGSDYDGRDTPLIVDLYVAPISTMATHTTQMIYKGQVRDMPGQWSLAYSVEILDDIVQIPGRTFYEKVNIPVSDPSYLVGQIRIEGPLKSNDLTLWIDYTNNEE